MAIVPGLAAGGALAQIVPGHNAERPLFSLYDGYGGFQEIALGDAAWYVAFYGSRGQAQADVDLAWAARVAQLCESAGRKHFVAQRYVGEPVLNGDRHADPAAPRAVPARGTVFVPIFIPSGPHVPVVTAERVITRQAPVRCVGDPDSVVDRTRVVSTADALVAGRAAGLLPR